MKKTKIQNSMDEYILKIKNRTTLISVFSTIAFMALGFVCDKLFHIDALTIAFIVMILGAEFTLSRGLKRHIKNIKSLDQWRSGKNELGKELETIQSHIQFLKSREAKATLPAEKIKELMASYTEAEKATLEGIERCDSIVGTVQGHITGERLIQ